jgi:signal transduction histidine kinase
MPQTRPPAPIDPRVKLSTSKQTDCPLAGVLAARLRESRDDLTRRWLERISARVSLDANRIFPTDELLDHVPILIDGIAAYIENPAEDVGTDAPVIAKAMELGQMRHDQGFDAFQIFKEYEILGSVLYSFLAKAVNGIDVPCSREELLHCGHRLFTSVVLIQQATAMQFLRQTQARVKDREERLRGFNRTVSHELKNRLGAAAGAVALLKEQWVEEAARERFLLMAEENLGVMKEVLDDLVSLSRLDETVRQQRNVRLGEAIAEVRRRLRDFARTRKVSIEIDASMPEVEVDAAAVELCLTNYVSNAVKYSDPGKDQRWVRVTARIQGPTADRSSGELIVEVADNGLGIPREARVHLFDRFYRVHHERAGAVEGTGLGLSIVRDTVKELGGRVWAEPNDIGGSVFGFAIPSRRQNESSATPFTPKLPIAEPSPRASRTRPEPNRP